MLVGLMGYLINAINEVHVHQSSARTLLCHTEFYSAKKIEPQRIGIFPETCGVPSFFILIPTVDTHELHCMHVDPLSIQLDGNKTAVCLDCFGFCHFVQ